MNRQKGFTLVELLVVIAIIGLLSTLAVVSLGSARSKARDARRISDIRQIQTALELYFASNGAYPQEATAVVLGDATHNRLSDAGFTNEAGTTGDTYLQVPAQIKTPSTIADYSYTSTTVNDYTLTFELEGTVAGISGSATATPGGIQ